MAERRRLWKNNGTAAKQHPSRSCRAGRREQEQRAVQYAACVTFWVPDFHSTRCQPATAAGVPGRGLAQVHGLNVNNIIRPTNVHAHRKSLRR